MLLSTCPSTRHLIAHRRGLPAAAVSGSQSAACRKTRVRPDRAPQTIARTDQRRPKRPGPAQGGRQSGKGAPFVQGFPPCPEDAAQSI